MALNRKRLQFGLRGLFAFMTIVGAALGLLQFRFSQVNAQREAVRAIEASGGTFLFRYYGEYHEYPRDMDMVLDAACLNTDPPGPAWARSIPGDFFFAHRVKLSFSFLWQPAPVRLDGKALVTHLSKLPRLDCIDLKDTDATEETVVEIRRLFPGCEIVIAGSRNGDAASIRKMGIGEDQVLDRRSNVPAQSCSPVSRLKPRGRAAERKKR